jgi:hypothetical protein
MNAYHIPDFHREWIELGLLRPMDWNINILQSPEYYRIDVLPETMKQEVAAKYNEHIDYLKPIDEFTRASKGYMSAVNYMMQQDNTHMIPDLLEKLNHLDKFRNENFFDTFPELAKLKDHG